MFSLLRQCMRVSTACVLITILGVPLNLVAQAHVVTPSDLQQATVAASQTRQRNLETLTDFLSSSAAQKAMRSAHMQTEQVRQGVASLSDAELAQLAVRAQKTQADFAAGTLSDRDLLLIVLGIAALVLIIVAVR
jgi:hypothetical protein